MLEYIKMLIRLAGIPLIVILPAIFIITGCSGPQGEVGPSGPVGPPGSVYAEYVGSSECGNSECHQDIVEVFSKSGHPFKLNKVENGDPPQYPYSVVSAPPEGYTWDDITYVIGGYGWKARFIDKDGYIITGVDESATTQYNLYNENLRLGPGWTGYHAGEEQKPYDCGSCHTTGYRIEGNQDGLPGLIGTWSEPGIQCEACHGPGENHVNKPYGVAMKVDRSAELCGECHSRGAVESINASGGFIRHHEQYEELFQSKHRALTCVACHDPHRGVIQARKTGEETVRVQCEACHFQQAKYQDDHQAEDLVACIDCHMPYLVKSAYGNADAYAGDIRAHLWAIDPDAISQFAEDGTTAISQLSLDFACRSCHRAGGPALALSDQELHDSAEGYHERQ
jgi:hypothetical protein